MRCPCKEKKCHLGVHKIVTKQEEICLKLNKTLRKFYLGHGIKTSDPKEAAKLFLQRDHKKIFQLLKEYYHGKLGVYLVPPMFFGEVPEAIKRSEYKVPKYLDKVRGDIAESKVYHALKKYFEANGDDVVIVHSHKFLHKDSNNEKDFIIFNLSKGKEYIIDWPNFEQYFKMFQTFL
jgi:hypothetical protein